MIGIYIRFMADVNKNSEKQKRKEIMNMLKSLKEMPKRFPFFNEELVPYNKYHKMFVEKCYFVLYHIKDSAVYVEYILDCEIKADIWETTIYLPFFL
jgi:hypothetical protein